MFWRKRGALNDAVLRRMVRQAATGKIVCKGALRSIHEPGMRARLVQIDRVFTSILDAIEEL